MSDNERRVKERWPEAYSHLPARWGDTLFYVIISKRFGTVLGRGMIERSAWADAAARLEGKDAN